MERARRILVVEDNRALAENLAEILEEAGYQVVVTHTAEEGLDALAAHEFGGIVTDLRLPGISGIEFIARIRTGGQWAPIVVLTAFADTDTVAMAERLGALDVLPKPVDFERLFGVLREFFGAEAKVLVVEDTVALAENVAEALRGRRLTPIVATTMQAAVSQRSLPRVALVDLRLPDGDGIDVARRLFARDPSIHILLTTGYADELALGLLENLPGVELPILEKPVDLTELIRRLESATQCSRRTRS